MNRRDLIATFISANNEFELQKKLFELGIKTDKMPHIINIYVRASKVIAWVFVETKHLTSVIDGQDITDNKKSATIKKKKTKKKVVKK